MPNDNTSLDLLAAYLGKKPKHLIKNREFRAEILKLIYAAGAGGGGGAVSTVFGRAGAVTAQTGDYTFAQIGTKPTTLSGYGITDAVSNTIPTLQFAWVVGGASNFASLPGAPTPPVATATTLTNANLAGVNVRMWRNGFIQMPFDNSDGDTFYTKVKANSFVTFNALQTGDKIIVETIPL